MNKKQFSLLACTALLCACQPAQKQTTITGTLTGMESDTLIVNYFAVSDLSRRTLNTDTVALQAGKFTCSWRTTAYRWKSTSTPNPATALP